MFIEKVKGSNFKNLANIDFEFSRINVFSGDNGSGKSSLMEILKSIMTNSFTENLADYVNWDSEAFKILSTYGHENKKYETELQVGKGTHRRIKEENGKEFFGQEAIAFQNGIIPSILALYSAISEQGESYTILKEGSQKRLGRLKSILGMDSIAEISSKLKLEADALDKDSDAKKIIIKAIRNTQKPALKGIDDEIDISSLEARLQILQKQKDVYDEWRSKDTELKIATQQVEQAKQEREDLEAQKQSMESEIAGLKETREGLDGLKLDLHTKKLEVAAQADKVAAYNKYLKSIEDIKSKLLKEEKEMANIVASFKDLNVDVAGLSQDSILEEKANAISHLERQKELQEYSELGVCPICKREWKIELSAILGEISIANHKIQLAAKKLQAMDLFSKSVDIEMRINIYKSQLEDLEKPETPKRQATLDLLKEEEAIQQYTWALKRKEVLEHQLADVAKKLPELLAKIQHGNLTIALTPPPAFNEIEYRSLEKEIPVARLKNEHRLEAIKENDEKQSIYEQSQAKGLELQKECDAIDYQSQILYDSKKVLDKQFSSYVIDKATKFIEFKMNEFFQRCYPKYEVFFKQDENRNGISFYYSKPGTAKLANAGLASGFEKQLLSMSFRIALGCITNIGIFILDEVDSDASVPNSLQFYNNLLESNYYEQIFIITHKPEVIQHIENNFDGVKVFELTNGAII